MPADPVEFAGWVGRKCTAAAAEKIISKFYKPHKRDASKVVNPRQEQERTLFNKKVKQKSEAGKRGMASRWKQRGNGHNSVITEHNIPIPIPIPISNLDLKKDLKRLIEMAIVENSKKDKRLVEIGVIQTMLQRNGSTAPINSIAYFTPEIEKACSAGLKTDRAINAMLRRRREQIGIVAV